MEFRIFDSHAHYDDARYEGEAVKLLKTLHIDSGVAAVVNAAADLSSCESSKNIAEQVDFVYFTAGIHPESAHVDSQKEDWLSVVEQYASHPKCVAIGEIGLDYYYGKETADIQKNIFKSQLELACKISKPVVIHDREAHADCLELVNCFTDVKGVFHSYSGSFEMARQLLETGKWYLSFNGILTFKNARKSVEVLKGIAEYKNGRFLDRILVETDAPYLAPVPFRGKTNDSGKIIYTAQCAAEIIGISVNEFCELTFKNACDFYGLDKLL